jgi:hypothetical protein
MRSRGRLYPYWRYDFGGPRVFLRPMPRFRYHAGRLRLDGMDRAMDRLDRARERRFALEDRLGRLRLDRQDRLWRRQEELRGRMMDRVRERMDRLRDFRSFRIRPWRYRMI